MATWLITGCSTGLGRVLATTALDRGETVVVTARDAAGVEDLVRPHPGTALALSLDVTDHAQVRDVVRTAQERFGAIDVLVNNAGHSYPAALRKEVAPLGITVMTVEPGAFRTNFLRNVAQPREAIGDYASTVGARRQQDTTRHGHQPGDPARAARAIITAVQSPDTPPMLVLGPDALTQIRDIMKELNADVDAWEQTSLSTSFPG